MPSTNLPSGRDAASGGARGSAAIRVTSVAQQAAWSARRVPEPEQVADGVVSIGLPMPHAHLPSSFCYAITADDGVHLVDPGMPSDATWDALVAGLAWMGADLSDVRTVTATHLHPDHLGTAQRVRAETGAAVVLTEPEQRALLAASSMDPVGDARRWGVPLERVAELASALARSARYGRVVADVLVRDREQLPWPGRRATAVLTPGHTTGHLCIHLPDDHLLLTGDHVLPTLNPGIGLGGASGDPVSDCLASLERVGTLTAEALPGHGYRFVGLADRTAQIRTHHLRRSQEIADARAAAPRASVWDIASAVTWSAGWDGLAGFALWSALAQTEMHLRHLDLTEQGRRGTAPRGGAHGAA